MKKTLLIESHSKLYLRNSTMVVCKETPKKKEVKEKEIPLADVELIILESQQISITTGLLNMILQKKIMVVVCDNNTMPRGIFTPFVGNVIQTERQKRQLAASVTLKKQMWQHIIKCKIHNQAVVFCYHSKNNNQVATIRCVVEKSEDKKSKDNSGECYCYKRLFIA